MFRVTGGLLGILLGALIATSPVVGRPVAPGPPDSGSPGPTAPASAPPVSASVSPTSAPSEPGARRWSWPLAPRPAVARRFDPPAQRWLAGHRGVDLASQPGAAVFAPVDGVVAFAGSVAGKGVVSVDHAGGLRSTYEPVQALVTAGQEVRRGQKLGVLVAEGGHCPPRACLHWGARRGADYVDPLALVGAGPVVLLPMR